MPMITKHDYYFSVHSVHDIAKEREMLQGMVVKYIEENFPLHGKNPPTTEIYQLKINIGTV